MVVAVKAKEKAWVVARPAARATAGMDAATHFEMGRREVGRTVVAEAKHPGQVVAASMAWAPG